MSAASEAPEILLRHHLRKLKLPTVLREHEKLARQCAVENVDHVRYLARLVELELLDREARMIERRIKAAKFPAPKSLDAFDFDAIPTLNKRLVLDLARCEFVERRENVVALGPVRHCLSDQWRSNGSPSARPTSPSASGSPPAGAG